MGRRSVKKKGSRGRARYEKGGRGVKDPSENNPPHKRRVKNEPATKNRRVNIEYRTGNIE